MIKEQLDKLLADATLRSTAKEDEFLEGLYNFDENCEAVARERDCVVVYPKENELQIDIDDINQYDWFLRRIAELQEYSSLHCEWQEKPSSSGGNHKHIYVQVYDIVVNPNIMDDSVLGVEACNTVPKILTETERILLQFALGSDPIRETLNTFRLFSGLEKPTRLFEPKE